MENGNGHVLPTSDFFSEVPAPCGLLGLDGTVRAINPAFSEMFGWAAEDLLDTSYIDRLHVDDRERTQSLFQECLSEGRARLLACRFMHKLGSYRLLYWGIKPSFEEGVVYAGGQDVTDLGAFPLVGPLAREPLPSLAGSGKSNPTKRELEVLGLAAQGLSTQEVAVMLTLSPTTVKTHLQHTYGKLGVTNRAAAVATALRQGLI